MDPPRPPEAEAALLTLLAPLNATRVTLATITPDAPLAAVGNNDLLAGILFLSPMRKMQNKSHQEQIKKQNDRKLHSIHNQAHACATTVVAIEREKGEKEYCRTTNMGYEVHLTKATINRHVPNGRIGTKPPPKGIEGSMLEHAFNLLVLPVESLIQINQVNCVMLERLFAL